ncbi:hypothetical protein ACCO45_006932 [Purpureocillium lilacinum]|uniref:Uncharacterized protein n=1 Tax=Purpureocillium lilacinum TaxID=33203 RepID=A0ACC4DQV8_PURLI
MLPTHLSALRYYRQAFWPGNTVSFYTEICPRRERGAGDTKPPLVKDNGELKCKATLRRICWLTAQPKRELDQGFISVAS